MNIEIYALIDPRTNEIRYVGYSKDSESRLNSHINDSIFPDKKTGKLRNTPKCNWIRKLIRLGYHPKLEILDIVSEEDKCIAEVAWIAYGREQGWRLTNSTDGGDGISNPSKEIRQKNRESHLGKKASEDTRRKQSIASSGENNHEYGKHPSITVREKMKISAAKRWNNESERMKMSEIKKKNYENPEYRKRRSELSKKQFEDPIARKSMSDRLKKLYNENPEKRIIASEKAKKQWEDEKFYESHTGENHPMFGKKRSESAKFKSRETWRNPELRKRRSELSKEQWNNPESRDKLLEARKLAKENRKRLEDNNDK